MSIYLLQLLLRVSMYNTKDSGELHKINVVICQAFGYTGFTGHVPHLKQK